jgi:hypothetical protein
MTVSAVALNIDEALDVHLDVFAQIALDVSLVLNHLADTVYLFFTQILNLLEGVNICLPQNLERARVADAKNVRERDPSLLVAGQIDASNTCHSDSFAASFLVPPALTGSHRLLQLLGGFIASLDSS